jgi:hypothetical protein
VLLFFFAMTVARNEKLCVTLMSVLRLNCYVGFLSAVN